jgi:hypothetical protein
MFSHRNAARLLGNPALSAILTAVQPAWVASALAGAAALHSSAHAERAHAPSPSRFWTVAQFVQILLISTAFKAYAFIPRLPLAREDAERTGACRVYRHQDGEHLIRIADPDRCKSAYACRSAKTMRRCAPPCVSWLRQRELGPRHGLWQVQPHHMRSHRRNPITCAPTGASAHSHTTHAWGHPWTPPDVARNPSIHSHHSARCMHTHV